MAGSYTVTVDCLLCGDECEAHFEVIGSKYHKATWFSPEEWPELYQLGEITCPNGCLWTASETITLELEALAKAHDQLLECLEGEEDAAADFRYHRDREEGFPDD